MRYLIILAVLVLSGCQSTLAPFSPKVERRRPISSGLTPEEETKRRQVIGKRLAEIDVMTYQAACKYWDSFCYDHSSNYSRTLINRLRDQICDTADWPPSMKQRVRTGHPVLGMTTRQVLVACGHPSSNRTTETAYGTYRFLDFRRYNVMLKDGRVVQIGR